MTHPPEGATAFDSAVQILIDEGFDGLGGAMTLPLNGAMRLERGQVLEAEAYERTSRPLGYANGFKPKSLRSRLGELRLQIPRHCTTTARPGDSAGRKVGDRPSVLRLPLMPHEPRLIIPGHLHEITIRAFQGRSFFVPSKRSNALIVGAMGYAQEQTGLDVCFDSWMSNHAHLLVVPDSEEQLADLLRRRIRRSRSRWESCVAGGARCSRGATSPRS